jgi:NAD(P)-dependent dehydrogenase (short-subunit alcohol dehydrogenase family)
MHIFATARNISKMGALADKQNITLVHLDVTDRASIKSAVATVSEATGGKLDYLVNNAGRNRYMPVLDEDLDVARQVFETNVWGAVAVLQGFKGLVISAKGVVVSVSSVGGHCTVPYMGISSPLLSERVDFMKYAVCTDRLQASMSRRIGRWRSSPRRCVLSLRRLGSGSRRW